MPVKRRRESAVERDLVKRVEILGGLCLKVRVIGRRGFFDRLIVLPDGRIIFVEVKAPVGGRLATHQIWYAEAFKRLGVRIAIVRNQDDIARLLK
jgi:hypothetical protein